MTSNKNNTKTKFSDPSPNKKNKKSNQNSKQTKNSAELYSPMLRNREYYKKLTGDDHPIKMKKSDERNKQWDEEFIQYGFDSREIWNVDHSMLVLLYERLCMFRDFAPLELDSTHLYYNIGKKKYTTQQLFDELVAKLEELLGSDDFWTYPSKTAKKVKKIWRMWGELSPAIWW